MLILIDSLFKIKFIKLLLAHNSLQIAITFTDQLIREELVHYYYFPDSKSFKEELQILKESTENKIEFVGNTVSVQTIVKAAEKKEAALHVMGSNK